jgi:hypothetical protein
MNRIGRMDAGQADRRTLLTAEGFGITNPVHPDILAKDLPCVLPYPLRRTLMRTPARSLRFLLGALAASMGIRAGAAEPESPVHEVGVGRVDITPKHPVRLSGYATRREESTRAAPPLWAKALAVSVEPGAPFLLLAVDNCGVPAHLREDVLRRLQPAGVTTERFALTFTHTHSAPCLTGALENIFAEDVPPAHQANIDRYTRDLADKLVQVGLAALADRKPARL